LVLAEWRLRRTRTSMCSDMRRLLRRSAVRRSVVQERVSHFVTGLMACAGMAGDNPPFVAHHSA